jgi:hypothetical protein
MRCVLCLLLCLTLLVPGCIQTGRQKDLPVANDVIVAYPFAPTALRIHPLTHVESGWERAGAAPERSQLILHLELLDRYGDSVKGLGVLKVELFRPAATAGPGMESQDLSWDVPGMELPEANTRRFDMATRTYRVPLVAPTWLAEVSSKGERLRVRVTMRTPGQDGERVLEDEYLIQG